MENKNYCQQLKMNMRTEHFEMNLQTSNLIWSNNWGAYSF